MGPYSENRDANDYNIERLQHERPECTGNWRFIKTPTERVIRCDTCHVDFPATNEVRSAAIDENYAGIYLRRLAAEGAAGRQE